MLTSGETAQIPGILFHILHRAHVNAVQTELHARGLSDLGSPLILFILQHHGEGGAIASQRELAQALHVSPATVAMSLKSLERLGYVAKRADENDARRNRITITEKGTLAVERCLAVFQEVDRRMMSGLSPRERGDLDRLLRKMLDNLGADRQCEACEEGGCGLC